MHVTTAVPVQKHFLDVYSFLCYIISLLPLCCLFKFFFYLSSITNAHLNENKQVQYILLSDTSIEQVAADVNVFTKFHSFLIPLFRRKLEMHLLILLLEFL